MTSQCFTCGHPATEPGFCTLCGDPLAQIVDAADKQAAPAPDWPDTEDDAIEHRTVRKAPRRATRTRKAVA